MKHKSIAAFAMLFVLAAYLNFSQADSAAVSENEKTFKVKSGGTLYLESDSGSVDVESHSKKTVEIFVKKKGSAVDNFIVTFKQDGQDVYVEGEKERGSMFNYGGVHFIVKVPEEYNVDLDTGGGSIKLADLNGKVDLHTSGGSITMGQIKGDVNAKTSGGSIRVEEVAGNIKAHTSGGSIKAVISKQPTDDCKLTTSGGSVTAYLLPSIKVDLSASTSGGRVRSDFQVNGSVSKKSIKGEINGGGPDLVLRTSGGSVTIKEI